MIQFSIYKTNPRKICNTILVCEKMFESILTVVSVSR